MKTKTIAGKKFEQVGEGYAFQISSRHNVVIIPTETGWLAKEQRVDKRGSYMEGTKQIHTLHQVKGETLNEVAEKIFSQIETEPSAKVKASMKYNETNVKQIKIALNKKTDADIIKILETKDNIQGYIKELIRKDNT